MTLSDMHLECSNTGFIQLWVLAITLVYQHSMMHSVENCMHVDDKLDKLNLDKK